MPGGSRPCCPRTGIGPVPPSVPWGGCSPSGHPQYRGSSGSLPLLVPGAPGWVFYPSRRYRGTPGPSFTPSGLGVSPGSSFTPVPPLSVFSFLRSCPSSRCPGGVWSLSPSVPGSLRAGTPPPRCPEVGFPPFPVPPSPRPSLCPSSGDPLDPDLSRFLPGWEFPHSPSPHHLGVTLSPFPLCPSLPGGGNFLIPHPLITQGWDFPLFPSPHHLGEGFSLFSIPSLPGGESLPILHPLITQGVGVPPFQSLHPYPGWDFPIPCPSLIILG